MLIPRIKVIGIGGGGCNAVNRMADCPIPTVTFYVANTDQQALDAASCPNRILLGPETTKGLGAGSNPALGRAAALECEEQIKELATDCDLVFLACGMGGGTGTGALPVFAKIMKDLGVLTIAVVTRPFSFEGQQRALHASDGLRELRTTVDSLLVISNDRLLEQRGSDKLNNAFSRADEVLKQSVETIAELVSIPTLINLDFADIKNILSGKGMALIGLGRARGSNRAKEAAEMALNSVLVETSISGARQAIVAITAGSDLSLAEAGEAVEVIRANSSDDVNIIFGVAINPLFTEEIFITLIATDLEKDQEPMKKREISIDVDEESKALIPSFILGRKR